MQTLITAASTGLAAWSILFAANTGQVWDRALAGVNVMVAAFLLISLAQTAH